MEGKQITAVVGSRLKFINKYTDKRCFDSVKEILSGLDKKTNFIISGGASSGADFWVKKLAPSMGFPYIEVPAIWSIPLGPNKGRYNPKAGLERNTYIAQLCSRLVAVWDGKSRGTYDVLNKAQSFGKPIWIVIL